MTNHQRALQQQLADARHNDAVRFAWHLSQGTTPRQQDHLEELLAEARRQRDYHQRVANHGTEREGTSQRPD